MKKLFLSLFLLFILTANAFATPALNVDFISERAVDISLKGDSASQYGIASWYFDNGILYVNCSEISAGGVAVSSQRITSTEPMFPAPVILTNNVDKFSDITKYRNEILMLNSRGIINGYPDGTFAGDRAVKRAEISVMLFKAGGYVVDAGTSSFNDVAGHWSANYVNKLNELGIINGYTDGSFRPEKRVKVAEVLTLINKMFEFYGEAGVLVPNVEEHWSKPQFENLVKMGIILPEDEIYKNYQPEREATRYEVALLLARALNKDGNIK